MIQVRIVILIRIVAAICFFVVFLSAPFFIMFSFFLFDFGARVPGVHLRHEVRIAGEAA